MTENLSEYTQGWENGYEAGLENGFSIGYQQAQLEMIQMAGQASSLQKAREFMAKFKDSRAADRNRESSPQDKVTL